MTEYVIMDEQFITQLTLEYLMSAEQKKKLQHVFLQKGCKKDKRFYRRRILNLTKDMLLNNYPNDLLTDVKDAFENYVKTCIGYFKIKDEVDIYQEKYKLDCILDETTMEKLDTDDLVTPEEADKLMMRSIKINKLPLDGFVKVRQTKPHVAIVLPQQTEVNLKDPVLRKKGIPKKNIITTPYKNEKENKTEVACQKEITKEITK